MADGNLFRVEMCQMSETTLICIFLVLMLRKSDRWLSFKMYVISILCWDTCRPRDTFSRYRMKKTIKTVCPICAVGCNVESHIKRKFSQITDIGHIFLSLIIKLHFGPDDLSEVETSGLVMALVGAKMSTFKNILRKSL